ncbi:NINE protein [Aliarcobacter butzleri]|uniref:TM2 domain-containing protein n=1 Tax=Aliarcobacter butzleri L348 TaxID=1447256 RepID=A0A0G9JQ66_9BACT|nr:TM2 domain-containing protein [Aliarcobacter butzleri]KLD96416.1 hypothetical protein AA20_11985 [Aliarcobacter butzleri L348]KLE04029.1 hypothetical protein AF78_09315 [Aliarcobacter butzleri L353]MCG3655908.1 TM2 domain-containing protein [Aliarcobacter butzleri]MCG3705318.1 TM2 domain-containing protein [Aliarcobacter butzleri]MCT7563535.1 TM2 domain-containing protein [Aliarcobacter butzleri]
MDIELEKIKAQQQNVILAYILWWFLGIFGAHRFYTGQSKGWLYIVLTIIAFLTIYIFIGIFIFIGLAIWWIFDGFKLHKIVKENNLEMLNNYQKNNSNV